MCRFLQRYTEEVVTRGRAQPDALKAAELITACHIWVADDNLVSETPEDLQHYQLGHGEIEALALTTGLGESTVMVTDDFLALIVANRLGLLCQLFLDFIVRRAVRGELPVAEAQQVVQAVSPRYPAGFVPHSLAMLRRLQR
jgi:predicted nucleic acid-binding protein